MSTSLAGWQTDDSGKAAVSSDTVTSAVYIAGAAYKSDGTRFIRLDGGVQSTDVYLNGTRHTFDGAMYYVDSLPSPAVFVNGIVHNTVGARYIDGVNAKAVDVAGRGITNTGAQTVTGNYPLSSLASAIYDFAANLYYTRDAALNTAFTGASFASLFTYTGSNGTRVNSSGLIEAATTNQPRFDYDPVTLAPKGILIEEARTNLALYSEQFDNAVWTLSNPANMEAVVANQYTAPTGLVTMDKLQTKATTATHFIQQDLPGASWSAVLTTHSVFLYYTNNRWAALLATDGASTFAGSFDLLNGVVGAVAAGTTSTIQATNIAGVYRCSITFTPAVGDNLIYIAMNNSDTANFQSWAAAGTETMGVWGEQTETGGSVSSYIPTTSAAVTRTADVGDRTLGAEFNATEGTMLVKFIPNTPLVTAGGCTVLELHDGTANNVIHTYRVAANGTGASRIIDGGVTQADFGGATSLPRFATGKNAFGWELNDLAHSTNGAAVSTDLSATIPVVTTLSLGRGGVLNPLNGTIALAIFYPTRLSDAQLQSLSTL